jgi:hypothetical protein
MAQSPELGGETAPAHGGRYRHAITPFGMPGKLLVRNYLRLVGKILQDDAERVSGTLAETPASGPAPGRRKGAAWQA